MKQQKGFSVIEVILVVLVVGLMATIGWLVYDAQTKKTATTTPPNAVTDPVDPNEGYFVVKEWGVRFKVPAGLTDVEYQVIEDQVIGDQVVFYAKPTGKDVEYNSNYKAIDESQGVKIAQYALGTLYRSTEPTKLNSGSGPDAIEGKKLGEYYYYTANSFSGLATGAGALGLYFTDTCLNDSTDPSCAALTDIEGDAFALMNKEGGLLRSIELAK